MLNISMETANGQNRDYAIFKAGQRHKEAVQRHKEAGTNDGNISEKVLPTELEQCKKLKCDHIEYIFTPDLTGDFSYQMDLYEALISEAESNQITFIQSNIPPAKEHNYLFGRY